MLINTSFTFSVWAKISKNTERTSEGNVFHIFHWNTSTNESLKMRFHYAWNTQPEFQFGYDETSRFDLDYNFGEWNHFVGTYDNSTFTYRLYMNGELKNTLTKTNGQQSTNALVAHSNEIDSYPISVGDSEHTSRHFDGDMKYAYFWNAEAKSEDFVKQLYVNQKTVTRDIILKNHNLTAQLLDSKDNRTVYHLPDRVVPAGLARYGDIWTSNDLQTAGISWIVGEKWTFRTRVKSEETGITYREIGFSGGGGYLQLHIEPGVERDYEVTDTISNSSTTSNFEPRYPSSATTGRITFTNTTLVKGDAPANNIFYLQKNGSSDLKQATTGYNKDESLAIDMVYTSPSTATRGDNTIIIENRGRVNKQDIDEKAKSNYTQISHNDSLNSDEFTVTGWVQPDGIVAKNVASFDGSTHYLEIPYTPILNTPVFTITAWLYTTGGASTSRSPFSSRDLPGGLLQGWYFYVNSDNKYQFGYGNSGWNDIYSSTTDVVLNRWTHITIQYNGTNGYLYVDNRLVASNKATYIPNSARPLRIGAGDTQTTANYFYPGYIHDFRYYSYPLTEKELNDVISHKLLGTETMHLPLTKMESAYSFPNSFNTITEFNGTDFIEIPYTPKLNILNFTVALWAYFTTTSGVQSIVDSLKIPGSPQTYFGYDIYQDSGALFHRIFTGANTVGTQTQVGGSLSSNTWYHIVLSYEGSNNGIKKSYVNGVLQLTENVAIALNDSIPLTLGNQNFNSSFTMNGNIYDFRYYNRALSYQEVNAIYQSSNKFYGDEVVRLPLLPGIGDRSIISSIPKAPILTMTHYPTSLAKPNTEKVSLSHIYNNKPETSIISSQQKNTQNKKWAAYFGNLSTMRIPYDAYHMNERYFSITFWMNLQSSGHTARDYNTIYSAADQHGGHGKGHRLQLYSLNESNEYIRFQVYNSGSNNIDVNRNVTHYKRPLNNRWVHIVVTYSGDGTSGDSATGKIIVDGGVASVSQVRGYGSPVGPSSSDIHNDFVLGGSSDDTGNITNGTVPLYMRDFRYYNRVISDNEIKSIYNSGATLGDEKVHLFYQNNEGVVDTYSLYHTPKIREMQNYFGLINGGDFLSRDRVVTPAYS